MYYKENKVENMFIGKSGNNREYIRGSISGWQPGKFASRAKDC